MNNDDRHTIQLSTTGPTTTTGTANGTTTSATTTTRLTFQTVLARYQTAATTAADDDDDDSAVSLAFFELANAGEFDYRLTTTTTQTQQQQQQHHHHRRHHHLLRFQQHHASGQHTGGIVWETAVLLFHYFRYHPKRAECWGNVVELGAGCGFLGQALAAGVVQRQGVGRQGRWTDDDTQDDTHDDTTHDNHNHTPRRRITATCIVQTETPAVLVQLAANLEGNFGADHDHDHNQNNHHNNNDTPFIRCCALDWTRFESDAGAAGLAPHTVDTLLGTDVIFTPSLVRPLLQSMDYLAKTKSNNPKQQQHCNNSHHHHHHHHPNCDDQANGNYQPSHSDDTTTTNAPVVAVVYLCVQVRCATSHDLFLQQAVEFGFDVHDWTHRLADSPHTAWGLAMDCHLYRLER